MACRKKKKKKFQLLIIILNHFYYYFFLSKLINESIDDFKYIRGKLFNSDLDLSIYNYNLNKKKNKKDLDRIRDKVVDLSKEQTKQLKTSLCDDYKKKNFLTFLSA